MKQFFLLFIIIQSSIVFCNDLKFMSADFPPYTYLENNTGKGAFYEVVQELGRRVGQKSTPIEFIPWARARLLAESLPNIGIIPLARTDDRELKYIWLIHVVDDPYILVTKKSDKFDISSAQNSKNLTIGTLAGSAAETFLKNLGFTNIVSATNDIQNVKKLKLGRIDAWAVPRSCIDQYKINAGLGKSDLREGLVISVLHEYIGASKNLDSETQKKWRSAFDQMKTDGTYSKIMKKYGLSPLP